MREPARILVVDDVPDNVDVLRMRRVAAGDAGATAGGGVAGRVKVGALLRRSGELTSVLP
jgi:CheY-like chemotaxis protein